MSTSRSPSRDAAHAFDFRDPSTSDQKTIGYYRFMAEAMIDAQEYSLERNVVAGYEDGLYRPDDIVTRDQMAVYIARAFNLT